MKDFKKIIILLLAIVLIIGTIFFATRFIKNKNIEEVENIEEVTEIAKVKDDLLRSNNWSINKDSVKNNENKHYSKLYKEGDNYLSYQDVSIFNNEFLLTYLFNNDKLVGLLYELDSNDSNLSDKYQEIVDALNKNYQDIDYNIESTTDWSIEESKIPGKIWNEAINKGDLKLKSEYDLNDYKVYLNASQKADFDFLFSKYNKTSDGNLYILLTPEKIENLKSIKPELTKQQENIKDGKVDIFEESINEDNINKKIAKYDSEISILKFNKLEQYLVLINNTNDPISLTDWYITTHNSKNTFYFDDGFKIKPGEQLLIYANKGNNIDKKGISRELKWSEEDIFDEKFDAITLYNSQNIEVVKAK